jgi:hypothetical protein
MNAKTKTTISLIAGITSLGVFIVWRLRRNRRYDLDLHAITPSPLNSVLPILNKEGIGKLAYTPDYFPGARDINTPYGSCRIYEFGPESGLKVLLVCGISTPCISLGGLAHELVSKGCRVILYGNVNCKTHKALSYRM